MSDKTRWISKLLMVAAVPALVIAMAALLPAVMATGAPQAAMAPVAHAVPPAPPDPPDPPDPPAPPGHRHGGRAVPDEAMEESAWLGVTLTEIDEEGAQVSSVAQDSPAQEAGLRKGDRIVDIEGQKVVSSRDVIRAVRRASPGDRITIRVLRDGDEKTLTATLAGRRHGERHQFRVVVPDVPDLSDLEGLDVEIEKGFGGGGPHGGQFFVGPGRRWLGVEVHPMSGDLREALKAPRDRGVLVNQVVEDSPAAEAGLRAGDIIISVGATSVEEISDIGRGLEDREEGDKVPVRVIRDGSEKTLDVKVSDRPSRRGRQSWILPGDLSEEQRAEALRSVSEAMHSAQEALRRANEEMGIEKKKILEHKDQLLEQLREQMEQMKDTIRLQPVQEISTGSVYDI